MVIDQDARSNIGDVLCSEAVGPALATHLERMGDEAATVYGFGRGLPDAWTCGLLLPVMCPRKVRMGLNGRVQPRRGDSGRGRGGGGDSKEGSDCRGRGRGDVDVPAPPRELAEEPSAPPLPPTLLPLVEGSTSLDVHDVDAAHRPTSGRVMQTSGTGVEMLGVKALARKLKTILQEDNNGGGLRMNVGGGGIDQGKSEHGSSRKVKSTREEDKIVRAARARKNTLAVVNRVIASACFEEAGARRIHRTSAGGVKSVPSDERGPTRRTRMIVNVHSRVARENHVSPLVAVPAADVDATRQGRHQGGEGARVAIEEDNEEKREEGGAGGRSDDDDDDDDDDGYWVLTNGDSNGDSAGVSLISDATRSYRALDFS